MRRCRLCAADMSTKCEPWRRSTPSRCVVVVVVGDSAWPHGACVCPKMKEQRNEWTRRKEDFEQSLHQGSAAAEGSVDRLFVERVRRELTEVRDKHLKAEIRRLQTEEVTLERELKRRVAEETSRVEEAAQIEEDQLRAKEVRPLCVSEEWVMTEGYVGQPDE